MQKTKLPNLITILIITLVTVVVWVGFDIYRAFTVKPSPSVPEAIAAPISSDVDNITVKSIEGSLYFNSSQIPAVNITAVATPTPAPTFLPKPIVTNQASVSATPIISPTPFPSPIATP